MQNLKFFGILSLFILLANVCFSQQKIDVKNSGIGVVFKQEDKILNAKKLLTAVSSNEEAYLIAKKGKGKYDGANVLGAIGGFAFGYTLGAAVTGSDPNWAVGGGGVGLAVVSLIISSNASKDFIKAVEIYNSDLDNSSSYYKPKMYLSPANSGLGISLNF